MFECPTCGESFDTERGGRVHHWRAHDERLDNRECFECDETFHSEYEQKYCSDSCRDAAISRCGADNPNYRGAKERTNCQRCGSLFEYYPSSKPGRFCSTCVADESWQTPPALDGDANPRWSGGKQELECSVCGEHVKRYPSGVRSIVVCGESCRREWLSNNFAGENHPNWKGGGSLCYGSGWEEIHSSALERDNYQCQLCGVHRESLDRNPDVHHIISVRDFLDSPNHDVTDAHALRNVISLCPSCHRHAEYGGISRERLRSMINFVDDGDYIEHLVESVAKP